MTTPEVAKSEPKKSCVFTVIALSLSVIAVAFGTYNYIAIKQNQLGSYLQDLDVRVTDSSKTEAMRAAALQQEVAQLKSNIPLESQKTLAEVSYWITIANAQLSVNYDVDAALQTLKTAQQLLASSNDARFMGLSAAIQSDRELLHKVPAVHESQLFTDISALIEKVQSLSSLPAKPVFDLHVILPTADVTKPWYKKCWDNLAELKHLVIIRHVDANNPPLVAPNMEVYLKQNIMTQLTMAQMGLLHHNEIIYKAALQNALTWVTGYFALTPEKESVMTALTQLIASDITPSLPALTNTTKALSQVNIMPLVEPILKTPDSSSTAIEAPKVMPKIAPKTIPEKPANAVVPGVEV